ncbi:MAG TPA: endospore germination permease [Clostridia bacterium]
MIKEGKIGVQEAISLIVITISIKGYFTSPSFVASILGPASWYMTLISSMVALIGFTVIYLLLKRFPNKGLIEAYEESLGGFFGFIFTIILFLYLLISTGVFLREFAETLKIYVLLLTPISFTIGIFLIIVASMCFCGLEGLARTARLFALGLLGGFLLVIVLASNNYDFHNLLPFWGYGPSKTALYGAARSSFYGEVAVLGIIANSLQGLSHLKKAGFTAVIISGLIIATALAATMAAFNYRTAEEVVSRMYELTRLIRIDGFWERLDPLFIFTWCIGTVIHVSFMLYCSISTYCKAFKIQDTRPVILPLTIVLFAITMLPNDFTTAIDYVKLFRQNGWIIYFGLPLVVLIIAVIRKKKGVQISA